MKGLNSFSIDIITTNPHGNFRKNSSFDRKSTPSSFKETLALAVANESASKINEGIKKTSKEIKPKKISLTSIKDRNEKTIAGLRKEYLGQENKLEINNVSTSKENGIPQIFLVIARTFYNLIARTPYDEDYAYTSSKKVPVRNKRNKNLSRYVFRYKKQYHHADNDIVKDEWFLEINSNKTLYSFSKMDFSDLKFESIKNSEYKKIARKIYKTIKSNTIESMRIYNTNPRVDMLEFGGYVKKRGDITKNEIHKGKKRYHGSWHGYSVQAPRGFIALTFNELKETETTYEEFPDELSGEFVRYTVNDLLINNNKKLKFTRHIPMDAPIREQVNNYLSQNNLVDEKDILGLFYRSGNSGYVTVKKNISALNKNLSELERKEFLDWKKEERELKKLKKNSSKNSINKKLDEYKIESENANLTIETPSLQEKKIIKQTPLTKEQIKNKLDSLYKKKDFAWIKKNIKDSNDEDEETTIYGRITIGDNWYLVIFDEGQFRIGKYPNSDNDFEVMTPNDFFYQEKINDIEKILKTYTETERY